MAMTMSATVTVVSRAVTAVLQHGERSNYIDYRDIGVHTLGSASWQFTKRESGLWASIADSALPWKRLRKTKLPNIPVSVPVAVPVRGTVSHSVSDSVIASASEKLNLPWP